MELLRSEKFKLPTLYFITDRKEIRDIPIGVPYVYGNEEDKEYFIRLLEYEVLYQRAIQLKLPFNFRQILIDNGFDDIFNQYYHHPMFIDYATELGDDFDIDSYKFTEPVDRSSITFKEFVKDASAYVNIDKLKELNVFPVWLDKIEKAVETNIHNFAVFNQNMYNKKLDGMYGGLEFTSPDRNLIIIDISGSIPKSVSSTCLTLSKTLAETFYADLLITGSKSTLYPYEILHELNINTIYNQNGTDNDQVYFKKLLSSEEKHYRTAIVFGDNHHPGDNWDNKYNSGTKKISDTDGQNLCKWKIDKLISFHTEGIKYIAGYSRWFSPKEIEKIDQWVKYLN
jgi:hypothetical protein